MKTWRYSGGDDPSGRRFATCIEDESIKYYGQWGDGQPNGFGAISKDGVPYECGYFSNGILIDAITPEEYEKRMNAEQNATLSRSHTW
ncbi:MAG: hypothetical protein J6W89_01115 [Paludibacteraceae bacterium]|nr:hypothetical protein [Paludibacteraceae bacterium]